MHADCGRRALRAFHCRVLDVIALLRTLHGWIGLLAAVLLLHPVFALARPAPQTGPPGERLRLGLRWSVGVALGFTVVAYVSGWLLYPDYRVDTKPLLLGLAPWLARAFESKEHLCFYVLVLALGAVGLLFLGAKPITVRWCFALASGLALSASVLGVLVGAFRPGS